MAAMDIATAMVNVRTMLGGLAIWQTLCGVGTAAEALPRIYYGGTDETSAETLAPCIILDFDAIQMDWMPDTLHGDLPVEIQIELPVPPDQCGSYGDQYLWVWQQLSAIVAGINGAVNNAGGLMMQGLQITVKPGQIDPDENQGRTEWGFVFGMTLRMI